MSQEVNISVNESSQEVNVSASENIQEVNITSVESVEYSPSYNNLTDKPTLFSGSYNDLTDKPVRVGFSAKDSNTSMGAATFTDVAFDDVYEDTHSAFDGTVFTVPTGQDGMYEVLGHATFLNIINGNRAIVMVYVNDSATTRYMLGRGAIGATTLGGYGGGVRIPLNAGDNIRMKVYCGNATQLSKSYPEEDGYTTFSAYKMYP